MKRNESREALLKRWYAGQTTEAEERQLRRTRSGRQTPRTADELLLAGLSELAEERHPATAAPRPRGGLLRLGWTAAAAAAVAVGIFLGVQPPREPYCYIDGVAVYDKTQALAATECLQGLGALDTAEQLFDQLLIHFDTNDN